jgi:xylulokinase
MTDACGLDRSVLPAVYESADVTGKVTERAAALTGLQAGTPVVGGGGDQASSAVGNGIVESGIVSCTLGTSGVVFAHMDTPHYDPRGRVHTFCHAVRGKWHVMGVTQGAGLSLQWFRNQFAPGADYDQLTAEAAGADPGSQGLYWLPYLMGERTPHLDASARAAWVGLTAKHSRADLIRSVIEGVSYSQRDGLDIIEAMGVPVESVRLSGGGARSQFWRQLMADVLNKRVVTLDTQEGSAYGAALLALTGTGVYGTIEECCRTAIHEMAEVRPRATEARAYQQTHKVYQSIYPALKPVYGSL